MTQWINESMKQFLCSALFLLLFASLCFAQPATEYCGIWKIDVAVSGLKAQRQTPTYLKLNPDSSYAWGIDSTADDPMKGVSKGRWIVNAEGEIAFTSEGGDGEIRYYHPVGNSRYKYTYVESNGKKTVVQMLEMDFYIEKTQK